MVAIDAWQEQGFGEIAKSYLARLAPEKDCAPRHRCVRRPARSPHLSVLGKTETERRSLVQALAVPSWLDPRTEAAAVKLLRTIRLDPSDTFVFERAASPASGRSLVPSCSRMRSRSARRQAARAFRGGFLGVASLGWSTLAQIVEASEADRAALVELLAQQLLEGLGAPDLATARAAAEEEVAFAASLCDHPKDMLIAVRRTFEDGAIREAFRTLPVARHPQADARILVPGGRGARRRPGETIDLMNLGDAKQREE